MKSGMNRNNPYAVVRIAPKLSLTFRMAGLLACLPVVTSSYAAFAANTIDPNNIGLTNVVESPFGTPTTLTNPVADPFVSSAMVVLGFNAPGELRIDDGSDFSNAQGIVGLAFASAVTVTGPGSTWTNSDSLNIGSIGVGHGTLNIEAGGHVSSSLGDIIQGTATVTGANSNWTNSGPLRMTRSNAALNILAGGTVSSSEGEIVTGTATVTGAGSAWNTSGNLFVGGALGSSPAALNLQNNGQVNVPAATVIRDNGTIHLDGGTLHTHSFERQGAGVLNHTDGTLRVDGGNFNPYVGGGGYHLDSIAGMPVLELTNGATASLLNPLSIASVGNGTLRVEHGSHFNNNFGSVAVQPGSVGVVTVRGDNTSWNNNGGLIFGQFGNATLNIEEGGTVTNTNVILAWMAGSVSTATVTGTDSLWNNAELILGGDSVAAGGSSTLNIQNNGRVNVATKTMLWNTSTINLAGGTLNTPTLNHSHGGTFNFTAGTLSVGTFTGTLDQDGGTLAPGNSPGSTLVTGDYNLNAGVIELELGSPGGPAGTTFDELAVQGQLNLGAGSTLDLPRLPGYNPQAGDIFPLITAVNGINGRFANVNTYGLDVNLQYIDLGMSFLNITVVGPEVVGDLDLDGDVDDADFGIAFANFTGPNNGPPSNNFADLDKDGDVDDADFGLAFAAFTGPGSPANVPEPGSLAMLGVLGLLGVLRR